MYLRYGDPSWDAADASEPTPPLAPQRRRPTAQRQRATAPARRHRPPATPARSRPSAWPACGIDAITEAQCIEHILDELDAGRGGMLVTPNLDHLHRCTKNLAFGALVAEADLVVADGMPLVWASRLQGTPLPERVAGSNLITTLSGAAAGRGRSIYLLGGVRRHRRGRGHACWPSSFPSLKVAGTWYPPLGFENDPRADGRDRREPRAPPGRTSSTSPSARPSRKS